MLGAKYQLNIEHMVDLDEVAKLLGRSDSNSASEKDISVPAVPRSGSFGQFGAAMGIAVSHREFERGSTHGDRSVRNCFGKERLCAILRRRHSQRSAGARQFTAQQVPTKQLSVARLTLRRVRLRIIGSEAFRPEQFEFLDHHRRLFARRIA